MIQLPNGCRCSKINVTPANWRTVRASLSKPWYISFRFYDPVHQSTHPKGKFVLLKGMNAAKDLQSRQAATRELLAITERLLTQEGWNPITGRYVAPIEVQQIIDPMTGLVDALKAAAKQKTGLSASMTRDLRSCLRHVDTAAVRLGIRSMPVSHVSRKHVKALLAQIEKDRAPESPYRYNKNRSCLMLLFKELMDYEAVDNDPVSSIAKKSTAKKMRQVLTLQERQQVDTYLHAHYYEFWRFTHIFFHSGARLTEMVGLQAKDVDLKAQLFKLVVKKGKQTKEVLKPIKDLVVQLWRELLQDAAPDDYLFSRGLKPGPTPIQSYQITKRWYRLVKQKDLGISADFYSLKHLNLDETATLLSLSDAQVMASHDSKVVTMKFYASGEELRQLDKLKRVCNPLA